MIKTHEAMDAYILATDIAVRFGAGYVGTEHLVYALMTGDCMTARVFTEEEVASYETLLQEMSEDANSDTLAADRTPAFSPRLAIARLALGSPRLRVAPPPHPCYCPACALPRTKGADPST